MYLTIFWALLPIVSSVLFCTSPLPEINMTQSDNSPKARNRAAGLAACMVCIFLGSAAENAMTNWISVYMESALQVPKVMGDILGVALFAVLLGLGRTMYAKYGKNISSVLLCGMAGAVVCYLAAGVSPNPVVSMLACILTGLCTSMLWPGTLILMEERFPNPGVAAYALMAAGGDLGGSVAPQLLGVVVDTVSASGWANQMSASLSLSPEQIGMKVGMLVAALFPLIGVVVLLFIKKRFVKRAQ